tara:strand:+ start:1759 stop:2169 length:411 start_codon:yes stop_codon:yes gene_type:complete
MPAVKVKSKGTALLMEISAVYTAIPQLLSISISGEATTTYDSTTLDGPVHMTNDITGYTTAPSISAEGFYDPDDTVITAYAALLAAPVATNFKVTYVDTTPTSAIYAGTGFGLDKTVAPADGVKCSYTIQTSGTPS